MQTESRTAEYDIVKVIGGSSAFLCGAKTDLYPDARVGFSIV